MNKALFSKTSLIILSLLLVNNFLNCRKPSRPEDQSITPKIIVTSTDPEYAQTWVSAKSYKLSKKKIPKKYYKLNQGQSYLRLNPIKNGFNQLYFDQHLLPEEIIQFRNGTGSVSGTTLSKLAQEFLEEIKVGQKKFTHFKILKDQDFSYKTLSGLIIVKYKNYPFVLKLSIEHPHTIVQPFSSKSIEAMGRFVVGGNLRHLSNFTRIPNLERIKNMLSYNPFYLKSLQFPRKWYWKPNKNYDLKIEWNCNGYQETMYLPSIYATISDFIETESKQPQADLNRLSMKIATDTGFLIDPHSGNIVIEKGTHNYVLLDTEDFRLMVGLDRSMKAKKYSGWILELAGKGFCNIVCRNKKERREHMTTF
ncbi:hypothetical protein KBB68_02555 [Candidatus Babeliales bacterium]|nr:hypothetical protein [Candidatus Babeliales bacterium]